MRENPDVLREYIAQQTCWICGRGGWVALSQHLVKAHGLPAYEVREMAYMTKREHLISPELSEQMSKTCLAKFGAKRRGFQKGEKQPKHILTRRGKDIARESAIRGRRAALKSHYKQRKPHACPVCGTVIEFSIPRYCSPKCSKVAWGEAAKRAMTPERIAQFKKVLYKATADERSATAKQMWKKIRSWPIEEQKAYFQRRVEKRKAALISVDCIMCGKAFPIPFYRLHGKRRKTCSPECSKSLKAKWGHERQWTDISRAKLSESARRRHINMPQFGRSAAHQPETPRMPPG